MASGPDIPDPNKAAIAGMQADLKNYPQNWLVNAAAQMGNKVTIGGKTYDFTGLGNAAQSLATSDKMAQTLIDIQKNYGADYVKQRIEELKLADPTGYAARQQLFDSIMADAESKSPNEQMSKDLQSQVQQMLTTSGELTPEQRQEVQQNVRGGQVARGITLGNAPVSEEASATVGAQDRLRQQQQDMGKTYLSSGITPEDIQYRKIQQSLSNLGAFRQGVTPTAQFSSLSSAGNGSAPFNAPNYQTPATLNPERAAQTGVNFANNVYESSQNQANPWLSGLSLAASGMNAAANWMTPATNSNAQYTSPAGQATTNAMIGAYNPVITTPPTTGFDVPAYTGNIA